MFADHCLLFRPKATLYTMKHHTFSWHCPFFNFQKCFNILYFWTINFRTFLPKKVKKYNIYFRNSLNFVERVWEGVLFTQGIPVAFACIRPIYSLQAEGTMVSYAYSASNSWIRLVRYIIQELSIKLYLVSATKTFLRLTCFMHFSTLSSFSQLPHCPKNNLNIALKQSLSPLE